MVMLQDKAERGPQSFCPCPEQGFSRTSQQGFLSGAALTLGWVRQGEQGSAVPQLQARRMLLLRKEGRKKIFPHSL